MFRGKQLLRIVFGVHVVLGLVVIAATLTSGPWVIGAGRFDEVVLQLETLDFRWWVLAPVVLAWGLPIATVLGVQQAKAAGLEAAKVRDLVRQLLKGRQIPIAVDVDARVPVHVEAPLRIPVEVDTTLPVDELIDIETTVPVRTELPIDTEIETSVFGVGRLKVPIRTTIPIDFELPIRGRIRVRSEGLPVRLKAEVIAHLPEFVVPIRSRIETRIDLLDSLRAAQGELRRLRAGSGEAEPEDEPEAAEDATSPVKPG